MPRLPRGPPQALLPQSETEVRSLQYFRERVTPQLSGYFNSELWSYFVPQLGNAHPAIQHAVIAISAVHENLWLPAIGRSSPDPDHNRQTFALQQYTSAVQLVNQEISTKGYPAVELALICCILFICFETCQSNPGAALTHLQKGLTVFKEWSTNEQNRRSSPSLIKNLSRVFSHLDNQATLFIDGKPPRLEELDLEDVDGSSEASKKTHIGNLQDARDNLERFQNRLYRFIAANKPLFEALRSDQIPEEVKEAHKALTSELHEYTELLDAFLSSAGQELSEKNLQCSTLLKMHQKSMGIVLRGTMPSEESSAELDGDELESIVKLGKSLVDNFQHTQTTGIMPTHFSLESGLVPPLYLASTLSPNKELRREALDLLKVTPRQEGLWNSNIIVAMAESRAAAVRAATSEGGGEGDDSEAETTNNVLDAGRQIKIVK